jgi:hypothetical protein
MSGGTFDYVQYRMDQTISDIEDIIFYNNDETRNNWGDTRGRGYTEETIQEFKLAIWYLRQAVTYTQRIDWLLADDDGEETFHQRLKKDLEKLANNENE